MYQKIQQPNIQQYCISATQSQKNVSYQIVINAGIQNPTSMLSEVFDPGDKTSCNVENFPYPIKFGLSTVVSTSYKDAIPLICGGCKGACSKMHSTGEFKSLEGNVQKQCTALAKNGSWYKIQDMLQPRVQFSLNRIEENKVIAVGGLDGTSPMGTNSAEMFDFITENWTPLPNLPTSIFGHCTITYNKTLLVILGGKQNGRVKRYDIFLRYYEVYLTIKF